MTLRTRILALVVFLAVVPLGLIGLWMTGIAARSGEALLRNRLERALDATAADLGSAWSRRRAAFLDLADRPDVRAIFAAGTPGESIGPPDSRPDALLANDLVATAVVFQDADGKVLWEHAGRETESSPATPAMLPLRVDVHASPLGPRLGDMRIALPARDLFADLPTPPATLGMVLSARDPDTGTFLLPAPFDPELLARDRFRWGGEDWLSVSRDMAAPRLVLVAAAPLSPYTEPFRSAAAQGAWLLGLVAIVGLVATAILTARMTGSLERVAHAAGGIAAGRLDERLPEGPDEVGRVASAFNRMADSLRRTLAELSEKRSLALVGEFAASLAHEIRNPLTSIRVDLQMVEETLPPGSPARDLQEGALREIQRLDATVTGALHAARSGRPASALMDLRDSLDAAVRTATAEASRAHVALHAPDPGPPRLLKGDANALEQLFLNLLLNAIQASSPGSTVELSAEPGPGDTLCIEVRDRGPGMEPDVLERAFDPLFTTRSEGTGLGLPIARRIAEAHGGTLALFSRPGEGTTARVELPAATGPASGPTARPEFV